MKIFINGIIHCMDKRDTQVSALAWEEDRICDVGDSEQIKKRYPDSEIIDLNGRCVFPGFIDPHHHFLGGILYSGVITFDHEIENKTKREPWKKENGLIW